MKIVIRPIIRWFDLWIGVFVDRRDGCVYLFPVPCIGLRFELLKPPANDVAVPDEGDEE